MARCGGPSCSPTPPARTAFRRALVEHLCSCAARCGQTRTSGGEHWESVVDRRLMLSLKPSCPQTGMCPSAATVHDPPALLICNLRRTRSMQSPRRQTCAYCESGSLSNATDAACLAYSTCRGGIPLGAMVWYCFMCVVPRRKPRWPSGNTTATHCSPRRVR